MSGAIAVHQLIAQDGQTERSAKPQMKVPFLDLKAQHAPLIDNLDRAIREALESSPFAGGPSVERFEADFAAYCGSQYATGVGNGPAGLRLPRLSPGIAEPDELS